MYETQETVIKNTLAPTFFAAFWQVKIRNASSNYSLDNLAICKVHFFDSATVKVHFKTIQFPDEDFAREVCKLATDIFEQVIERAFQSLCFRVKVGKFTNMAM